MISLVGQSLGRYHVLEQLGEGGMALVYKAFDTRLERDVAIKIIRRDAFIPQTLDLMLKRFEREAKALARLSHPNIVKVLDYGEYESSPYLVLEYLPGGTLKGHMGKALSWQEAIRLLLPVARALAYAHQLGIIHRDVKPSNILMTQNDEPMLTDFGIAKILDTGDGYTLTGSGVGIGTPDYMAPEQGFGNKVDARADIYSLGIVFYELVTGRKPYIADTPMAVVLKHMTDPLPRPADFVPDLPEFVENVIIKTLAKSPEDRYANMGELVVAFERLLAEATLTFTHVAEKPPVPPVTEGQIETVEAKKVTGLTYPAAPKQAAKTVETEKSVTAPIEAPKVAAEPEKRKPRRLQLPITLAVIILAILALAGWAASQYLPAVFAQPTPTLNLSSLPGRFAQSCGTGSNEVCIFSDGGNNLKSIKLPLPQEFGQIDDLAWSPDGQHVVLAIWRTKTGKTENDLFVYSLVSNEIKRLTNGENNVQPAWSPDGQWIAYHSSGWAMITSPDGSNQQRVSRGYDNRFMAAVPAWSPDSEWLAWLALEQSQSQALKGLMVYSFRKQEVTFIPFAPSEPPDFNYELYWEPHGRYVYIWSPHYQQARRFDLACLQKSCAGLEPETVDEEIPREWSKHYYPQWRIAYPGQVAVNLDNLPASSLPSAPTQLPPNPAWLATAKPGRSAAPCLDNERELCIRNENEFVLERIKLTGDDGQPLGQISENGVWSPEGNRVVLSIRNGQNDKHNLYLYDFSNRSLTRLTNLNNNIVPAWSPDGIWIYFHSNCEARLIKPNGSGLTKLGANEHPRGYCSTFASWSPDSQLLARLLQSEDGATSLRAVAIDNLKNNATTIIPWNQSIGQNVNGVEIAWTPDGAAVLVQVHDKSEKQVYKLNITCLQTGCAEKDWQPVEFTIPETWLNYFYPRWGKDAPLQTGQKSVKIALQAPLSGSQASAGMDIQRAAGLAFEQLSGPLKEMGFSLEFTPFDDQANPEIGVQNAKKIVADETFLCGVGHFNSGVTIPASDIYHSAGIPFVSPTNTGPLVTDRGYLEISRVVGRDDIQGKVGAQFAQKQGYQSIFIIHDGSDYGQGLAEIFKGEAERLDLKVLGVMVAGEPKGFAAITAEITAQKPDFTFFAGTFDKAGPLFKQIRAAGYAGTLMGGDGLDSPDLVKLSGPALLNGGGALYTSILVNPIIYPDAAGFIKDFQAKYNAYPQPFAAPAYDAMGICLKAIENAARAKNGELPTRREVAQAIRALKEYRGITNVITFNERGDPLLSKYMVVRVVSADPNRWSENEIIQTLEIAPPGK